MKFAFIGIPGLEDLHIEEIKQFKPKNIQKHEGIIFFDCEYDEKLKDIKTADDILIFAKKLDGITRYKKSLGVLREYLRDHYIGYEAKTFSVKASYIGRRDYTAKDVEEVVAQEISKKYRWKSVKEIGDVHLNIVLHQDVCLIGVSIDDLPFYMKNKKETVPGSIRSSLASALVKIADVKEGYNMLDPMCGSGIISIKAYEAGAIASGIDIDKDAIGIAKKNAGKLDIRFDVGDATKTSFKEGTFDTIISNLPFGKKVKNDFDMQNFLSEMKRISKKDATWVFLSKEPLPGFEHRKIVNSGMELVISKKRTI